jgi:hypothetical protein
LTQLPGLAILDRIAEDGGAGTARLPARTPFRGGGGRHGSSADGMEVWLVLYLVATAAASGQALLLLMQTWEHRRFTHGRAVTTKAEGRKRRIAVIAPCKSLDAELADNLAALFQQDFPSYELIFVVDSRQDPAVALIERLILDHPQISARVVVSGPATACGQKVHNLRAAVETLGPGVDVLAFVDSDARPRRDWLRQLTRRIGPKGMEAASSYRWFVPLRPTLPNLMLASLDHSLVPLSCPGRDYLLWGGSWAIRRDVYERVGLHAAWQTALSDDMVARRVLTAAAVHIEFEPMAIVASPLNFDWPQMFAFLRRQFVIIRWNVPGWWLLGVLFSASNQFFFWSSAAAALVMALRGDAWSWLPGGVVGTLYLAHVARAWLRQSAAAYFLPDWQQQLTASRRFDIMCHPVAAALNLGGLLASAWGRSLQWRGIRYAQRSDGTLQVISPLQPDAENSPQRRAA